MAFDVQENTVFIHKFSKISLSSGRGETHTRSVASLPRFGPPLTNSGCNTVTGIYGTQAPHAPSSPVIGVKENLKKWEVGIGICHFT